MSDLADLLERLRRGAEIVAVAITGAAGAELDFHPGEKAWSIREIICHLADSETAVAMRMRQVISEDNPQMPAWDQDAWTKSLGYEKRKISDAMETFRRLRADNYELLKNQPEAAFSRTGIHSERGVITLRDLLQGTAEHAESHVGQIQRTRAAYREHKAKLAASKPA